jgi:hypothetical protein
VGGFVGASGCGGGPDQTTSDPDRDPRLSRAEQDALDVSGRGGITALAARHGLQPAGLSLQRERIRLVHQASCLGRGLQCRLELPGEIESHGGGAQPGRVQPRP